MQIKNNSSYSSSPPATNIKSRNICQLHKSLSFLLFSFLGLCVAFRCLFLPDRWISSWDCQHAEPSYQLAQTFPTFTPTDDTETTVKVSAAATDPLLCAGPAHLWAHLRNQEVKLNGSGWRGDASNRNSSIKTFSLRYNETFWQFIWDQAKVEPFKWARRLWQVQPVAGASNFNKNIT